MDGFLQHIIEGPIGSGMGIIFAAAIVFFLNHQYKTTIASNAASRRSAKQAEVSAEQAKIEALKLARLVMEGQIDTRHRLKNQDMSLEWMARIMKELKLIANGERTRLLNKNLELLEKLAEVSPDDIATQIEYQKAKECRMETLGREEGEGLRVTEEVD